MPERRGRNPADGRAAAGGQTAAGGQRAARGRRSRTDGGPADGSLAASGRAADRERRLDGDPEAGPDADPEAVARQICLRLLTAAPRTQAQLASALRRRRVPEEAAQAVLARFAEVKLIDDAMFARAWVESRHLGRGLAGRALGAELRQRGVANEDIQAALGELDPDREIATARELVARRLRSTAGQPAPVRIRRLAGMLARKGYAPGLAYRVVREALEHEPGTGPVPFNELDDLPEPDADEEAVEL
jgi:regulatory protein